ncbi:hypothetical protein Tco_0752329 [Tanacetum coccineum]|uniref:Uncharacterized protein n=1 Tax=Tanacetum coccineum TaxID=301880 RepID=A0ABQ4ZA44_9ASTR
MKIKESLNVTFDETPPPFKTSPLVDDYLDEKEAIKVTEKKNLENDFEDETLEVDEIVNIKESKNHPLDNVIIKEPLECEDGVASIKRRRHDLQSDGVNTLVSSSEYGQPKGTLEDSVS